jgi:hypothetical protein
VDDLLAQLNGALEQARSELLSSQAQWAQERAALEQQLSAARASLACTHDSLEHAVAKVRAGGGNSGSSGSSGR